MDKLKAFETFASVATRGSLSAAARAEGVAPAVVSRRLDALEEHLGVKLLVRTTRRIALTHEGTAFLDDCQRLLADVAGAEASVSAGGVQASGHLRLTAPAGFGRRHVAPLVPAFHAEHPRLRISLNLSDRVVELAAEGYDCAVRVGDLPDSSLVSIRLADNRRQAVAAPAYLARRGTPQHPRDLARHDCLVLSSDASQTRGWAFRVPRNAVGRNDERTPKGAGVPRNAVGRNDERTPKGAGVPRNAVGRNDERTPKGAGVPRNAV
ncbi:MAG: LysR family transcriptional regulator, partial [Ottowia sp.]|nr:LysR family transcriptional regulator [Ottowia sp.]